MSKRERFIALAAVSFIALAILYNFIIEPVTRQWQSLNSQMESKASALKTGIAIVSARKTIEENYSKFSKYVRSEKNEEESVAEVLAYLETLSRSDSCLILNIKPVGTKDFDTYKELLVDLSCEGDSSQLTKFLYDIENTKNMILKIRHFSLTAKAGQDGALRGTFLISKIILE